MPANYLENTEEKLAIQLDNFGSKIEAHATIFGFTAAEVTSAKNDSQFFRWSVFSVKKIETNKKNWIGFRNILKKGESGVVVNVPPVVPILDPMPTTVAPGVLSRFTNNVARIKAHPAYTTAIGQDLGIEAGQTIVAVNTDSAQPILKFVLRGGQVNLTWKKGKFSGIQIEKDSGNGFVAHDKDFSPDYIDTTPVPTSGATWKYRAIYLMSDTKVGLWSDIVTVSVAG